MPHDSTLPHSAGTAPPALSVPPLSCDAHIHIYDARFPTSPGAAKALPNASVDDYRLLQQRIGTQRAVVVTPGVYGTDNRVTVDAIAALGQRHARGVAVLHPDVDDASLDQLHLAGIRGLRFTLFNPATAVTRFDMIEPLAQRIQRLGWHVQLHMLPAQIVEHAAMIERLPGCLVFDHFARVLPGDDMAKAAHDVIAGLLSRGNTWIKFSGPYLGAQAPDYPETVALARALVDQAPERIVWGSDWPHPTEKADAKPDDAGLLDMLLQWAPDASQRRKILMDNPATLYGFDA